MRLDPRNPVVFGDVRGLTTECTEDHRGNRHLINAPLSDALREGERIGRSEVRQYWEICTTEDITGEIDRKNEGTLCGEERWPGGID